MEPTVGKQKETNGPSLSYWSVADSNAAGVAILLNPEIANQVRPWMKEKWTKREMMVTLEDLLVVNIYASTKHDDREEMYRKMKSWHWKHSDLIIMAGDFNCVQSPPLDRMGGKRSGRPESSALTGLCDYLALEDARILQDHAGNDMEEVEPLEYFTHWGYNSASRIDRFYVPQTWTAEVQQVEVSEPAVLSDHQLVKLWIRRSCLPKQRKTTMRKVGYPIRTAQPDRVLNQLLNEMMQQEIGKNTTVENWEVMSEKCLKSIERVKRKERNKRKANVQRLEAQQRAHLHTRKELLWGRREDAREEAELRLGQRLERTTEWLRWQFKRISNWEKDRTVSKIENINGKEFHRGMTVADRFASEWKPVLSQVHSKIQTNQLEEKFDEFVRIPEERKLTQAMSRSLMVEVSQDEVVNAIESLNRHKAAGPDGLNNDFFKDTQALLVPAMVAIGNQLIQGGEPPKSFLEGMIIPLKKKGDSQDAMDYRPIALLQTGYKVFAKVIATRVQRILGVPIGDSQQGFVHGRQMLKPVMMMLAILETAQDEPEKNADQSRAILLLDFRKAYDTVARDFLIATMKKFGFSTEFVDMIQKLHEGTTAKFLVNGELSQSITVKTGIRQGCPLAPLLFILAVETLAIAITGDRDIQGIAIPKEKEKRHKFSAFVDDSTVFLERADQVPRITKILKRFGKISGLQVQPAKSKIIFLNTKLNFREYQGIPVVKHGDTTRYLGYAVGTGELDTPNWAGRIRSVQRRLATATQLGTSVENRIMILNVIMLPSILFTAAVFEMPPWAEKQLRNIQKNFLWKSTASTEGARHKINPDLLFLPRQAGGAGLVSITMACKTQKMKQAILWLIQKKDQYLTAWKAWVFRGAKTDWIDGITPRPKRNREISSHRSSPGIGLQGLIGEWINPAVTQDPEQGRQNNELMKGVVQGAISWTNDDEWVLELEEVWSHQAMEMTQEEQAFWPTYNWCNNPWIVDAKGKVLDEKKFDKIRQCTIAELQICRTGLKTFTMTIPVNGEKTFSQAKLRRWGIAILWNAPRVMIGETLGVEPILHLRKEETIELEHEYEWKCVGPGIVCGTRKDEEETDQKTKIWLEQQPNGVHWRVLDEQSIQEFGNADWEVLRKHQVDDGVVFLAHPNIHGFPWTTNDYVKNKHVIKVLKKQPAQQLKRRKKGIERLIINLRTKAETSDWIKAALNQTPTELWAHKNELSEYQVWTAYRGATCQLNLYHEHRATDNSCRRTQQCQGEKETIEHILWECQIAQ